MHSSAVLLPVQSTNVQDLLDFRFRYRISLSFYRLILGDGTFTDVTRSANLGPSYYGNGAGWIDVDSDGDLDLFVTTVGDTRHYLYINNGGRFSEEGVERGVSLKYTSGRKLAGFTPVFGDFDQDGFFCLLYTSPSPRDS